MVFEEPLIDGQTDGLTDGRTDGLAEGQSLFYSCVSQLRVVASARVDCVKFPNENLRFFDLNIASNREAPVPNGRMFRRQNPAKQNSSRRFKEYCDGVTRAAETERNDRRFGGGNYGGSGSGSGSGGVDADVSSRGGRVRSLSEDVFSKNKQSSVSFKLFNNNNNQNKAREEKNENHNSPSNDGEIEKRSSEEGGGEGGRVGVSKGQLNHVEREGDEIRLPTDGMTAAPDGEPPPTLPPIIKESLVSYTMEERRKTSKHSVPEERLEG